MNIKDLVALTQLLYSTVTQAVGTVAVGLFLLSLYPPLSFIPKAFVLFVLTH